jgi:Holliday junction resolvasome RuvABC endonuclease subunit
MFTNHCEPDDHIGRIVGIDPGSTTLGCALIEYDVRTLAILRTCAYTFNADKMRLDDLASLNHSERFARIFALQQALYSVFLDLRPNIVISESPFLKRRFPTAFGVLTEVVFAIRMAVRQYDPTMQLDLIDPPSAKMATGATGKAKKDEVHAALKKLLAGLHFDPSYSAMPFNELDEHSVDAIAIAYSMWKKLTAE